MGSLKSYWRCRRRIVDGFFLFITLAGVCVVVLGLGLCLRTREITRPLRTCCFDNKAVLFFSLPGAQSFSSLLLPIIQFTTVQNIPYTEFPSEGTLWKAAVLKTDSIGLMLADFSKELVERKLLPWISIILDGNGTEYLLLVNAEGQVSLSSMKFLIDHFLINFKEKRGVAIPIPKEWKLCSSGTPLYLQVH